MVRITPDLLRKRSEHNDKCLSDLEEIALHQFKIEKIESIGEFCKRLKILLLQNNRIGKIENLHQLIDLQYLNLALNRITKIGGLERCSSLQKLDLTANYISNYSELSKLSKNSELTELYLTGNPCTSVPFYRQYVIASIPTLTSLDGIEISFSERIEAENELPIIESKIIDGTITFPPTEIPSFVLKDDKEEDELEEKQEKETKTIDRKQELKDEYQRNLLEHRAECLARGEVLQYNDTGCEFKWVENYKTQALEFRVLVPKHLGTDNIECDLNPSYIRLRVKDNWLQLRTPYEIVCSTAEAIRVDSTGEFILRLQLESGERIAKPWKDIIADTAKDSKKEEEKEEEGKEDPTDDDESYSDMPELE
ncbi:hypothetical protein ADUPG1_009099 [Aduncisulcus paluster]|uniref:Dynein axonemal assembly factor 11-like CS domain-containing protein n=1 Tax=Aduncisulcus paluster TaxID=2918883 RepID=A0ABQ5KXA7_9EUKA|nr:hypothetical protein ADUPG1_009099 [Aduncisulcus paluster]